MSIFQLKYSFTYLVLKISNDVLSLISFDILFQRLHGDITKERLYYVVVAFGTKSKLLTLCLVILELT